MPPKDKLKGKIAQTRVPEWADDDDNEDIAGDTRPTRETALEKTPPNHGEDTATRLRRLAESRIDNCEEVRDGHRLIRWAEIVSTIDEEARRKEGLGVEDALAERRRHVKEKIKKALAQTEEEEEEEEEALVRPVFVPNRQEGLELEEDEEEDALAERRRQIQEKNKIQEEELAWELATVKPGFLPKWKRYTIAGSVGGAKSQIDNCEEVRAGPRLIRQAEIVSAIEEEVRRQEGLDAEDEDALAERRRQVKEKIRKAIALEEEEKKIKKQEEALGQEEEEEEEEEGEGEGEEEALPWELTTVRPMFVPKRREGLELEEDEEEDALAERTRQIKEKNKMQEDALALELAMVKPGFLPKRTRYTIVEHEPLEAEEGALEEAKKRRSEAKDEEFQKTMELELEANVADVDTDDELNGAEEYEAWRVREIHRIKLDREVREAMLKVRNMAEEVMREWAREV